MSQLPPILTDEQLKYDVIPGSVISRIIAECNRLRAAVAEAEKFREAVTSVNKGWCEWQVKVDADLAAMKQRVGVMGRAMTVAGLEPPAAGQEPEPAQPRGRQERCIVRQVSPGYWVVSDRSGHFLNDQLQWTGEEFPFANNFKACLSLAAAPPPPEPPCPPSSDASSVGSSDTTKGSTQKGGEPSTATDAEKDSHPAAVPAAEDGPGGEELRRLNRHNRAVQEVLDRWPDYAGSRKHLLLGELGLVMEAFAHSELAAERAAGEGLVRELARVIDAIEKYEREGSIPWMYPNEAIRTITIAALAAWRGRTK